MVWSSVVGVERAWLRGVTAKPQLTAGGASVTPRLMSDIRFESLAQAAAWYDAWLREAALPLWAGRGVDARNGAFVEALTVDGAPIAKPRRARVQARQAYVFASAAQAGLGSEWLQVARRGYERFEANYRRADGLFGMMANEDGRLLDDTPYLYEQDFALLAMAALHANDGDPAWVREADRVVAALDARRHPKIGIVELGPYPYQANSHMHLLEAVLAWDELDVAPAWGAFADEIVELCMTRFIDAEHGFLREFFDEDWRPAAGQDGRCVEPGHQFEWAWLLERWGKARGDGAARKAARRLYEIGLMGVDRDRGVAMNLLDDDLTVRDASARLWPQTEYVKAALVLGDEPEALRATRGLAAYLQVPAAGTWRDKLQPDGTFVDEPAPATSLYHLYGAVAAFGQI